MINVSKVEIAAIKLAIEAGKEFGFGNIMGHLATAWARTLIKNEGFPEEQARKGSLLSGMPFAMQDDILNGFWDETGKRYKSTDAAEVRQGASRD